MIMGEPLVPVQPAALDLILDEARSLGFSMNSTSMTGALLRVLAMSKRAGQMLEIGTGVGVGTAWILEGMDFQSRLTSLEKDDECLAVVRKVFALEPRVRFVQGDARSFLENDDHLYDLVFADSFVGKVEGLELALARIAPGGFYVVDDLLPQTNWPEGHGERVHELRECLSGDRRFTLVDMTWDSGVIIATRRP